MLVRKTEKSELAPRKRCDSNMCTKIENNEAATVVRALLDRDSVEESEFEPSSETQEHFVCDWSDGLVSNFGEVSSNRPVIVSSFQNINAALLRYGLRSVPQICGHFFDREILRLPFTHA
jgi:hypothetical protein